MSLAHAGILHSSMPEDISKRRFTHVKKECARWGGGGGDQTHVLIGVLILSYSIPDHTLYESIKYKILSPSLGNYDIGNGKALCLCRNILSLAHAGI